MKGHPTAMVICTVWLAPGLKHFLSHVTVDIGVHCEEQKACEAAAEQVVWCCPLCSSCEVGLRPCFSLQFEWPWGRSQLGSCHRGWGQGHEAAVSSLLWMGRHAGITWPSGVSASPLVTIATSEVRAQLEKLVPGTAQTHRVSTLYLSRGAEAHIIFSETLILFILKCFPPFPTSARVSPQSGSPPPCVCNSVLSWLPIAWLYVDGCPSLLSHG